MLGSPRRSAFASYRGIYVAKPSLCARVTSDPLVETVRDLVNRGVGFKSLQENIDTTTSGGKLIFHIFASLAEFERDVIRERTHAGLSAARARGRMGGRPRGVSDMNKQKSALALKNDPQYSVQEICAIVGISRNTYYKYTRGGKVASR
jgi:DNA invertase Pin-like site-specific DNA recombinase